jgi:hypothetical protein
MDESYMIKQRVIIFLCWVLMFCTYSQLRASNTPLSGRETLFSIGLTIGYYDLNRLNGLLAFHNYKPLPETWKFTAMTIRKNILKSSHYAFFTYAITPNFDHYEASLNQVDYKYLNVSLGFVQAGYGKLFYLNERFRLLPFIAYRSDIFTMGYGQLSGSLGKNLQNPRPGQRSTGFVFSGVAGINLEQYFILKKIPSAENPFRFLLSLSLQSGVPLGRYYWYSNYSSLAGERYRNTLCSGLSVAFYL